MAKILVVDDSGLARRTTRTILERAGHEIVEADDGLTALERFFIDKPDLVLLDVTMKGMDGIEVLKRLREMDSQACIVIVTADVQTSTRELVEHAGATGFVMKPISTIPLLTAVEAALGGSPCN